MCTQQKRAVHFSWCAFGFCGLWKQHGTTIVSGTCQKLRTLAIFQNHWIKNVFMGVGQERIHKDAAQLPANWKSVRIYWKHFFGDLKFYWTVNDTEWKIPGSAGAFIRVACNLFIGTDCIALHQSNHDNINSTLNMTQVKLKHANLWIMTVQLLKLFVV